MAFQKGKSGNPAGRPKGSREKRLSMMLSNEKALQKKLVNMALEGDLRAMQIIADRLWPRARPEAMPIRIKSTSSDLSEQGRALIKSALEGEITADVLRDVLTALYGQARLVEATEIEERLKTLENRRESAPWEQPAKPKRRRRKLLM